MSPMKASSDRWRVDDGEEAWLTPEGPGAAIIESRGALPLRPRAAARGHHRPAFPGACVVLGGERFEVTEEAQLDQGFRYRLDPWPADSVFRDVFEYGPILVRAAQREREQASFARGAAWYSWLLLPFLGLLPEAPQTRACNRFDLDPAMATLAGALLEGSLAIAALGVVDRFDPGLTFSAIGPLALTLMFPALTRGLASVAWGDVAGSSILGALFGLFRSSPQRFDPMVLPLTREAFWARLTLGDRQELRSDGALIVRSVLPHLTWDAGPRAVAPRVKSGDDYWKIAPLLPSLQNGRLSFAYELRPEPQSEAEDRAPAKPPDPRQYQDEVVTRVADQWRDVITAAPWLVVLLPRPAQERAYRALGGPTATRRAVIATAVAELALASWFLTGHGIFNALSGAVLVLDALQRLWHAASGAYAPSVFGFAIADYLPPERVEYSAHRDAERRALRQVR